MSHVPQPPPPPPPPAPPVIRNRTVIDTTFQDLSLSENPPTSYVLARDVLIEELTRIALNEWKTRASHSPHEGVYASGSGILTISSLVQPTLQQGPMCGLVALEMAAQRLSPSLKSGLILEEARKFGYTRNGEMFSADQMANLAMHVLQCDATTLSTEDDDWSTISKIVSSIAEGNFILIPYDADFNHSPALRKGHSAHWGLLVGVTLFLDPSQVYIIQAAFSPKKEQIQDNILLFFKEVCEMKDNERQAVMESIKHMSMNQVYVNARQGKSKYIGLWKVNDLIGSNRNLKEIAPKITAVPGEFITSNIDISLCSKMVVLHCR